jgi:hypothetical protein
MARHILVISRMTDSENSDDLWEIGDLTIR